MRMMKSKNIAEIYQDKNNLLKKFNESLRPSIPKEFGASGFSYFDGSKLGPPVVVEDDLARNWLELNYLFSTGFRPNHRPGVGEIGADIRSVKEIDGQKYLTIPVGLLDDVVRALSDFRSIEGVCSEWLENQERCTTSISELYKKVKSLSEHHPPLKEFKEMFGITAEYIGCVGLPSEDFVSRLEKLSASLRDLSEYGILQETSCLNQELKKYGSAIPQLSKIRGYHKSVPHISDDGMIRIDSPAASGGLCMHTHPGYDDPYHALPSLSDLMLIAAQAGALGSHVIHVGGGETQGEHYVMHLPRKFFFEEVKQRVDKERVSDETAIIQIKQRVLDRRLDDLIEGEILGFKIDGKTKKRIAVLSPLVASREYKKHRKYLESRELERQPFGVKGILLEFREGYVSYDVEVKNLLAQKIGK